MKKEALKYFLCPECRGNLLIDFIEEEDSLSKRIQSGSIRCLACDNKFPIINYIPRFIDQDNYCQSFGFQWNRHRQIQIDKYNGFNFSRERLFSVSGWPQKMKNDFILEVGSGAGRFTQILIETGTQIFSFDYSTAVDANLENSGFVKNLHLFQGDLQHIPLCYGLFDRILCLGVLQHTPNPKNAFLSLIPFLKTGGQIVIDIYKKTMFSMIQWKYLLRPLLKQVSQKKLYNYIRKIVPSLLPMAIVFRKIGGSIGGRLLPIANYSHLGIPYAMNNEFSILDTFDMYSPEYDKPQTLRQIKRWFEEGGLHEVEVRYGPNGIVGKGIKKQ